MKITRIAILLVLVLACALAALLLTRNATAKKRSYVLGVIGNFNGKNAQVGVESFNAINLAYDEYKKSHPNGFDLNILSIDDSWDPTKTLPSYLSCADKADLLILLTSSSKSGITVVLCALIVVESVVALIGFGACFGLPLRMGFRRFCALGHIRRKVSTNTKPIN